MEQLLEFAGNHPYLIGAAVVTTALLIYNEIRLFGTGQSSVSPDQAVRLMNKGALVLDLRSPDAYAQGHLSGARNLDIKTLDEQLKSLERYRSKPVLAYDDRGTGTGRAIAALRKHDFEHVYAIRGGLAAWREDHLPIEKSRSKRGKK